MAITESLPKQKSSGLPGLRKEIFWAPQSEVASIPGLVAAPAGYGNAVALDGDITFKTGGYWRRLAFESQGSSVTSEGFGSNRKRKGAEVTITTFIDDKNDVVEGFIKERSGEDLVMLVTSKCGSKLEFYGETCDMDSVVLSPDTASTNDSEGENTTLVWKTRTAYTHYYTGTVSETPAV